MANVKTINPDFSDIQIVNSVDLQAKVTDYIDIIRNFPNEVIMANIYYRNKHTADPIQSDIDFFIDLHNNSLSLGNSEANQNTNVDQRKLVLKLAEDQLTSGEFLIKGEDGKFQVKGTTVLVGKRVRRRSGRNFKWEVKQIWKDVEISEEEINSVKDSYGFENMASTWFVIYWLDKFKKAHKKVQDEVKSILGSDNLYYANFSESIGQLRHVEFTKNTTVIPFSDTEFTTYGTPETSNKVIDNMLDDNDTVLNKEFSLRLNYMFRNNLRPVINDFTLEVPKSSIESSNTTAHGTNLVTDIQNYERTYSTKEDIISIVQKTLDDMYRVLEFIEDNTDVRVIGKTNIELKVEKDKFSVDLLKNRLLETKKEITNKLILSA